MQPNWRLRLSRWPYYRRPTCAYRSMQDIRGSALTAEEAKLAAVLGWCIEWVRRG